MKDDVSGMREDADVCVMYIHTYIHHLLNR
jgi:hypothetical protein